MSTIDHKNALPIGYQLHEYTIEKLLGHGGFGITYLAKDTNLNRLVAIKEFLPQEYVVREDQTTVVAKSSSDEAIFKWGLERFLEEARILAEFKHSNIVRVQRYFPANKTAYLVMDFEAGQTLEDYIKKNGFGLSEAHLKAFFLPILDGLRAAHEINLLHRDITPDNIYLRMDETPMLIDFGSARYALGDKTQSLTAMVKKGYAPFEQYSSDSKKQGPWTDIYSIGASLYFCIVGKLIPDANDRSSALVDDEPDPYQPLSKLVKGKYTEEFLSSIDHALSFKIKDRPQSVREFQQKLIPPPVVDVPLASTTPKSSSTYKIVAGLAILAGIGSVIYLQMQGDSVPKADKVVLSTQLTEQEKLKQQADNGDVNAQYQLALAYQNQGDYKSAAAYLHRAASKGHAGSQLTLGEMYLAGKGVDVDPKQALNLIQSAADKGEQQAQQRIDRLKKNVDEQFKLAIDFNAQGDLRAAYFFFHKAALNGHSPSQLKLGEFFQRGINGLIDINLKEANKWYLKAALQNNAAAQLQLAGLLLKDKDKSNDATGEYWLKKSVALGFADAMKFNQLYQRHRSLAKP